MVCVGIVGRIHSPLLHVLHRYVDVTLPLPLFLLHTEHSSCPGQPLAEDDTFSGECLPDKRMGDGTTSHLYTASLDASGTT